MREVNTKRRRELHVKARQSLRSKAAPIKDSPTRVEERALLLVFTLALNVLPRLMFVGRLASNLGAKSMILLLSPSYRSRNRSSQRRQGELAKDTTSKASVYTKDHSPSKGTLDSAEVSVLEHNPMVGSSKPPPLEIRASTCVLIRCRCSRWRRTPCRTSRKSEADRVWPGGGEAVNILDGQQNCHKN